MKVFIDMDGVLVNFVRPAFAKHGIHTYTYPPEAGWDIVKAFNMISPDSKMTDNEFWGAFDQKFWYTLPKTVGCDTLLRTVEGYVGKENICLLTSALTSEAAAGKTDWVRDNLPWHYRSHLLIGTAKHFLSYPGALLIDDRDKNVDDFRFPSVGGIAILVPRPWNSMWHIRLGDSHVLEQLAIMFGRRPLEASNRSEQLVVHGNIRGNGPRYPDC